METNSTILGRGSSMHGKCQAKTVRYVKLLTEGRPSAYSKAHRMARQNDTEELLLSLPASHAASLAVRNLCSRTLSARLSARRYSAAASVQRPSRRRKSARAAGKR